MEKTDDMMVYIGKSKISLVGLKSIFEELKDSRLTDEEQIKNIQLHQTEYARPLAKKGW